MDRQADVLLVNPTRTGVDSYCTPPVHLMYLSRALRDAGFTARILNVHERFCKETGVSENNEANLAIKRRVEREAIEEVLRSDARLIGIGSICSSYEFTERLARELKARRRTPLVLGGSLGLPLKDLWFRHTEVDYLCEADGERVIVELVRHLDDPEKVRRIPGLHWRAGDGWRGLAPDLPADLDYIRSPDLCEIDYEFYMDIERCWVNRTLPPPLRLGDEDRVWPVVLTRGCVYNCTFCFHFNRRHRRHSISYVIDHLRRLRDEFGVTVVVTWDDLVMASPRWFMDLCAALEKAALGVRIYTSGGKANLFTRQMGEAMARANFVRVSFGIESGSQRILDEMQKKTTVEDNRNAVRWAAAAGLFVHMNMVLGMPGETRETLDETYRFLIDVVRENGLLLRNLSFAFATAYPGTQLFDRAQAAGLVPDLRQYILNVKGVGHPEPLLCRLTEDDLKVFLAKVNAKVMDMQLVREGRHLRRIANRMIRSRAASALARFVPRPLKERIGDWLR
ncbi:MAG: radical SAM protein [Phycisphaerae bacterium]